MTTQENPVSELIACFQEWTDSFRDDIEAIKAILECEAADAKARMYAAGALNYVIARMDLVPDWNETIGMLDDVMVLRLCAQLANTHNVLEKLDDVDALVRVGRMLNDVETIETFLGRDLFAKLRKYCANLANSEVRGRSPATLLDDAAARQAVYHDVHEELLRIPAAQFSDVDQVMVYFKSYIHHKLN